MSEEEVEEIGFDEQLRLEAAEEARKKGTKTRTDDDGTVFEWDEDKRAWFPKLDEDFLAQYQLNYGSGVGEGGEEKPSSEVEEDPATKALRQEREQLWREYYERQQELGEAAGIEGQEEAADWTEYYNSPEYRDWYAQYVQSQQQSQPQKEEQQEMMKEGDKAVEEGGKKRKQAASQPSWYELGEEANTHVYVSGLPADVTEEEFAGIMSKCGMVMNEPFSNKPRIKLYRDAEDRPKGDGRCCYIKIESVDLALQIIDGSQLRNSTLSVQRARFQLKGDFDPSKRRKLTKKEKKKLKEHQENLFRWAPDQSRFARQKREKAVVLCNVFTVEALIADPLLLPQIKQKVEEECSKCGVVKRVIVHDTNHEGRVTVWFSTAEEADGAVVYLNKCIFYNGRVITAATWDGKTKYDVQESEEDRQKRLDGWQAFLESGEGGKQPPPSGTIASTTSVPGSGGTLVLEYGQTSPEDLLKVKEKKERIGEEDGGSSTDSDWLEGESDDEEPEKQSNSADN